MTISQAKQLQNIDLAFRLLLNELSDKAIGVSFFDPESVSLKEIMPTTWKELCDQR